MSSRSRSFRVMGKNYVNLPRLELTHESEVLNGRIVGGSDSRTGS